MIGAEGHVGWMMEQVIFKNGVTAMCLVEKAVAVVCSEKPILKKPKLSFILIHIHLFHINPFASACSVLCDAWRTVL